MSDALLEIITLASGFLVIYHHALYPLVLRMLARRRYELPPASVGRGYGPGQRDLELPSVTIVIPAYNEEQWICAKIQNLAVLDYPNERLKIVLACDGCIDRTAAMARACLALPECSHLAMEVREYPQNRGKVAVLNAVLRDVETELVALSDVSALVSVDALLLAALRFRDPRVGVLNSHYRILNPGSEGENRYWNYQSRIKASEAALGATLGAHGAFYLFRRGLFDGLAPDTINDDFVLPMEIVAKGYRAAQDDRIVALELEQADADQDRRRRKRISAGNVQQLLRLKRLLLPRYRGVAFAFASGKALRVAMPFLMIVALAGSVLLASTSVPFMLLGIVQGAAYLVVAWQLVFKPVRSHRLVKTLAYIVSGHLAGLAGTLGYARGHCRQPWRRITDNPNTLSREVET